MSARPGLRAACWAVVGAALGLRLWNALAGPRMWGYDAWGHVAYVLFLDVYRGLPWADQGWSYYHPPLHYALGWALAQFGSGEALVRGLALLGSAASLGVAALAAWIVRATAPERPELGLVAFGAVAFLPVMLVVGTMPGNELTQSLFSAGGVTAFIANERRRRPALGLDALTGLLLGLALLSKANGWIALVSVCAAGLALGAHAARAELGAQAARAEIGRRVARIALVAGVALAMVAPIYVRNARSFGTPLPSNSDFPLLQAVEGRQPPGYRTARDYVALPVRLLAEPDPLAPHLLHSVWGSLYLNAWADSQRETDVVPTPASQRRERRVRSLLAIVGLLPTGLALAGAALAGRDVWRGRRREVYVPLLTLCFAAAAALAGFSWRIPTWAALKASYVLPASLAYAAFLCRALEGLSTRRPALWIPLGAALVGVAATAGWATASGVALPRRADAPAMGAVHFYFAEYDRARRIYRRLVDGAPDAVPWLDNLAAVELADGSPEQARRLSARAVARAGSPTDPHRVSRLAAATALAGDRAAAEELLDAALASAPLAELLANRGAIRAGRGDLAGAEADLRAALDASPELVVAAGNLGEVLAAAGRDAEAATARAHAAAAACRAPRGYPYGVGTGEILEWGVGRRVLLRFEGGELEVAEPASFRTACRRLGARLESRAPRSEPKASEVRAPAELAEAVAEARR